MGSFATYICNMNKHALTKAVNFQIKVKGQFHECLKLIN